MCFSKELFFACLFLFMHRYFCAESCIFHRSKGSDTISSTSLTGGRFCTYLIKLSNYKRIHIEWIDLNLPGQMPWCNGNFIRITRCTVPLTRLIRYCGDGYLPSDYISTDNCVRIDFFTTAYSETPSFKIKYSTLNRSKAFLSTSKFPVIQNFNSYTLFSPNWPLPYSRKMEDPIKYKINWKKDHAMKVVYMELDLYVRLDLSDSSGSDCDAARDDSLVLKVTGDDAADLIYRDCGQRLPFTRFFPPEYKNLEVIFERRTSTSHNNRGFALGIVIFKLDEADSDEDENNPKFMLPIIIPIFFFGIVCFLHRKVRAHGGIRSCLQRTNETTSHGERFRIHPAPASDPPYTIPEPSAPIHPPPTYMSIQPSTQASQLPPATIESDQYPPPPSYNEVVGYNSGPTILSSGNQTGTK